MKINTTKVVAASQARSTEAAPVVVVRAPLKVGRCRLTLSNPL